MITKLAARLQDFPGPQYITAARAGIHPTILSNYKQGKASIPRHHLDQLARVFECEPEELVGWVDA